MAKKGKFDYFEAFSALSSLAIQEADLLVNTIENYTTPEDVQKIMSKAHSIEHSGDDLSHRIMDKVAVDFITPIEREDIIRLTTYLDDIIDYIEDVFQRFYMYDVQEMHPDAPQFARIILKSATALNDAMQDFRNFKKSKAFVQFIVDVNTYEEEADDLLMKVIRTLYKDHADDPMYVARWSQIFDRMEKCADACEHASDVMGSIMITNG